MGPVSSTSISALQFHPGRRVFPEVPLRANQVSEELGATALSLVRWHLGWPGAWRPGPLTQSRAKPKARPPL